MQQKIVEDIEVTERLNFFDNIPQQELLLVLELEIFTNRN